MSWSSFDQRLLADGPAFFDRPRLATLLELLGDSKFERTNALVTMLRHSPPNEFEELVEVFERALARVDRDEQPRRRRYSAAAERREQRRRAS